MKKQTTKPASAADTKKGYNEKNPGQPEGAFPPANHQHRPLKEEPKSNAADKKAKEDQS